MTHERTEEPRFGARSTAREVIAGHDLSGRDAIVTGGASGIGVETARALALAGARVVIATRNAATGEAVAARLRAETAAGRIEFMPLDLASLASIRSFVAAFLSLGRPLHLLVNNAGIMAAPFARTVDGFESQFGTNHLGHFALTVGLLPALESGAPARVVSLSSLGHRRSNVDFDDPNFDRRPYDRWVAYGQSKTANVLFAVGWTRRHAVRGVVSNAVHPGGILTGLQKHVPREEQIGLGWIDEAGVPHPRLKNVEQGAATSVWAAVAPELEGVGGLYLEDCAVAEPWSKDHPMSGVMAYALDPAGAERLWGLSEALVARRG